VHKSARSLLHLLNDILDTSKLEHGAVELESIDFSLTDLIHQLRAEQSIHAQRKQLTLTHDIDPGTGEFVRGDPHRLRQIVMNLVGNAIKFTERGSVTVQVRREAEAVHIAVRDTGIGIAPDRLPHIFDAFTQADATMSRRFGGTGLGTTISKQLTELMGGRIWAESEPGVGSTFHVRMPLPPGDATLVASTHRAPHTVRIAPMRVLIVDDVAQNLELLELLLTRQGHQVDAASDGQQALELARQHRYDIILMDVQMPVMDGLTASRALRAMEAEQGWPRTPMLALSASVLQDDRHAAMDAGMDGFATKPVEMPALMAEIARVTGRPLLPAEPGTDAPPPSVQPSELIQVQRGLDRWQNWPAYQQALLRFAREHTPPALPTTLRGEQAFQQAHRLKGLGANLGLTDIEQRAQALETWAREAPDRPLDSAWQALNDALARVIADIHRLTASQQASAADAATADLPASGLDRATLKLKLAQLQAAFRRGECLDAVLDEVRRSPDLRPLNAQLAQLMQASEDFDFDLAASLAQALIQALDDMEKPHAAL
jgi:CheY-like chemotaxis protein/anti-sigma regulatory factor (Ser/Thr protein kinase)